MPTYAVTGASGHLGRLVIESLLARGVGADDVVAVVRTPAKVADLADRGVVVREGDYSRPDTLGPALDGVRRVLLISGDEVGQRVGQHSAVVAAARAAGVERIAYTSILRADTTENPLAPDHRATEEVLRSSGLPFTVLRNGWYTENYTDQLPRYLEQGEIVGAAGSGRVSAAPRADYAEAAAAALVGDADGDVVLELGGPAFTFAELAATVSEAGGRPVTHRALATDEFAATLESAGLDAGTAAFVASLDEAIARGDLETDSDDLARLLGRAPTSLEQAVRAALA
ncbi:NAD(P)H-binding protein [uncultured Cellulomonas sp.]|uniref:NAD(P)H-binding protein n=1 Tax=uncultured Cellulomonas sp. TaxID=189682 RepID=UPI0026194A7E|nr:NAD(P)H-binding protein [uncultured Cellulomonas sp.]